MKPETLRTALLRAIKREQAIGNLEGGEALMTLYEEIVNVEKEERQNELKSRSRR